MTRDILLPVLLFFSVAAFAQSNDVDKSTVISPETNTIEISAVAIPYNDKDKFNIVSENYHKAITVGNDPVFPEHTVAITVAAEKPGDMHPHVEKKEIKTISSSTDVHSAKSQKVVEVTVKAIKR